MKNLTKIILSSLLGFQLSCSPSYKYSLTKEQEDEIYEKYLMDNYAFFGKINSSSKIKIPVINIRNYKNSYSFRKNFDDSGKIYGIYVRFSYDTNGDGGEDFHLIRLVFYHDLKGYFFTDWRTDPKEVWYDKNEVWDIDYMWKLEESSGKYKRIK